MKIIKGGNAAAQSAKIKSGGAAASAYSTKIKCNSAAASSMGANMLIKGVNANTKFVKIESGGADASSVEKKISGGNAATDFNFGRFDKWERERKEYRRLKRVVRYNFENENPFPENFKIMSYKLLPEEPKLLRKNLRRSARESMVDFDD